MSEVRTIIDAVAEILLSVAALYVTRLAFMGWRDERRARRSTDPVEREVAQGDAKVYFLLAGLQHPWVWSFIVTGSSIKLMLAILDLGGWAYGWLVR